MAELLALDSVNALYGESHVLHDISFTVHPGRLLALLGRNGAGKSSTIHSIVGLLPARSGTITFAGREIQHATPEAISMAGIGLVPQGRRIFPSLTVDENLLVAQHRHAKGARHWTLEDVRQLFPRLAERRHQQAGSLSGGEQQMLAIGRALMTNPQVLLLDEPSEGLAPQIVREVRDVLDALKSQLSIVLVEQNLSLAMHLADDVVMLSTGRVVFSGTRDAFSNREAEWHAYLGVG